MRNLVAKNYRWYEIQRMIRVSFGINNLITTKVSEPDIAYWKTATRRAFGVF